MSENFTQSDLQTIVTESITRHAIGLALQAQKIYISHSRKSTGCKATISRLCVNKGDGSFTSRILTQAGKRENSLNKDDLAEILISKYGSTKEEILKGPTDCFVANNEQQLVNPFEKGFPTDPKAPCVFNVLTCNFDTPGGGGKATSIGAAI